MAALAKALGSFNANLGEFADAYMVRQKAVDEQRREEAQQVIAQAGQYGTFRSKPELQRNLERAAAAGDQGAKRLLQQYLSKTELAGYYDEAVSEAALISRMAMFPQAMKRATMIPDLAGGTVDIRTLPVDSPQYQAFLQSNLLSGLTLPAKLYSKYQPALVNLQAQDYKRQEETYYKRQKDSQDVADVAMLDAAAAAAGSGRMTAAGAGMLYTQMGDKRFMADEDAGANWRAGLGDRIINAVVGMPDATPEQREQKQRAAEVMLDGLQYALHGPAEQRYDTSGKVRDAAYLINALGGQGAYKRIQAKLLSTHNELQNAEQTATRSEGEIGGQSLAAELFTPDVVQSPARLDAAFAQGMQRIASQYRDSPYAATGATAEFQTAYNRYKMGYSEPMRQQRLAQHQLALINAIDKGPGALQKIEAEILQSANSDPEYATRAQSLLAQIQDRRKKDAQPLYQEADGLRKAALKEWDSYSKDSRSYPGTVDTQGFEAQRRASANRRMQETFSEVIRQGKEKGLSNEQISEQLRKAAASSDFGLTKRRLTVEEKTQFRSLKEANSYGVTGLDWVGGGIYNQQDKRNKQLKRSIMERVVASKDELDRLQTDLLNGKPMDPELKAILKRTGMNPSDFFMYQWKQQNNGKTRNYWDTMPEDVKQRLRQLDTRRSELLSDARDALQPTTRVAAQIIKPFERDLMRFADIALGTTPAMANTPQPLATATPQRMIAAWRPGQALRARDNRGSVNGYMRRLAYLETRVQNVSNAEGSEGQGYFQAFDAFNKEATAASGIPMGARNPNYDLAAKATWAWIRRFNKDAAKAIIQGQYDKADRLLRNTWPSLPTGSQAQPLKVQREALRFLNL